MRYQHFVRFDNIFLCFDRKAFHWANIGKWRHFSNGGDRLCFWERLWLRTQVLLIITTLVILHLAGLSQMNCIINFYYFLISNNYHSIQLVMLLNNYLMATISYYVINFRALDWKWHTLYGNLYQNILCHCKFINIRQSGLGITLTFCY